MLTSKTDYLDAVKAGTNANEAYRNGGLIETDAVFDARLEQIAAYEDAHPEDVIEHGLLTKVSGGVVGGSGDVQHAVPMLSLDKTTDIDEMLRFAARFASNAELQAGVTNGCCNLCGGGVFDGTTEGYPAGSHIDEKRHAEAVAAANRVIVEPKMDGAAVRAVYTDGVLTLVAGRGDGHTGEDLTSRALAMEIKGLPKVLPPGSEASFEVRGEIYMSSDDFEFSNENRVAAGHLPFANPRNATAGTIRRETLRYESRMSFAAYDVLDDDIRFAAHGEDSHSERMRALAFHGIRSALSRMPNRPTAALEHQLVAADGSITEPGVDTAIQMLHEARSTLGFPIDGAVVKVDSLKERARIGAGSRAPKHSLAFKYPPLEAEVVIKDIVMAVGRTGNISFTAVWEPVLLDGSQIARATFHNVDWINAHDLRIGDHAVLYKAGDIIPRISAALVAKRPADAEVYAPDPVCPNCGEALNTSSKIWNCSTPDCSLVGRISYAGGRDALDIEGLGSAVALALVEAEKVKSLADIFYLTVDDLENLVVGVNKEGSEIRFGKDRAVKLVAEIEKAKSQPFNRVITSLGVRKAGRTFGRRLAAHFHTMDNLLAAEMDDFIGIDGIKSEGGGTRARLFFEGYRGMAADIQRMKDAGVNMGEEPSAEDEKTAGNLPLAGMKVVVTGAMTGPLAGVGRTAMAELIESKGGKASSSVSSSTSLLVCGEAGSAKWNKAQALGVTIETPEEFAARLGM